ncbi:MAG: hypothetical protein ABEJ60_04660 [Halodesulfurarchaeum sp.]
MGTFRTSSPFRVGILLVVLLGVVILLTEGVTVPCIWTQQGSCITVPPLVSLSRLFKFAVLLLTVLGFVFSYENWTSPKTELMPEKTRALWNRETGDYGIVLRNVGTSDATIRVLVRIDGEKLYPERPDATSCLYARLPHSSPFPGANPYPRRSRIARDDFRAYTNEMVWQIDFSWDESDIIDATPQSLPSVPIDGDTHVVDFEVQQTNEHYVFRYDSDGEHITSFERISLEELKRELRWW